MAFGLGSLGRHYFDLEDYSEAEKHYRRAVAIIQGAWRGHRPTLALYMNKLAVCYFKQSRYDEAEPLLRRALSIMEQTTPDAPRTAKTLESMAKLYQETDREEEARKLLARAEGIRSAR